MGVGHTHMLWPAPIRVSGVLPYDYPWALTFGLVLWALGAFGSVTTARHQVSPLSPITAPTD